MTAIAAIIITLAAGTGYDTTFQRMLDAYQQNDYPSAIAAGEQLVDEGIVNPIVFYNLGNAYFRSGRIGPAIANYERALHLSPRLDSAEHNLEHAVQLTKRHAPRPMPPSWVQFTLFWHNDLSPEFSIAAAMTAWALFWALLAFRTWRPIRYSGIAILVLAVTSALFGLSAWCKYHPVPIAVACQERVPVRFGADASEKVRFELFEGDRVVVDITQNDWIRITTATGDRGWVHTGELTLVAPPYPAAPPLSVKEALL